MSVVASLESEVRSYSRVWPATFDYARGSWIYTRHGEAYLDFFSGAGTLEYGHNEPRLKRAMIDYLERDGVTHSLDMFTTTRADLMDTLGTLILEPRGLNYKIVFSGPAGATRVSAVRWAPERGIACSK